MAEKEKAAGDPEGVVFEWMRITQAVARGRLAPDEGVARLRTLAEAHPADRCWLQDEIETIRRQFGLDVTQSVHSGPGSYWDKLRAVIEALLDERLDHDTALELLQRIQTDHPEHAEQIARLIEGIAASPLRQLLDSME